ncbi:MAG: DUF4865 domain-containing protein [Pseudonocardiales bacterium]|nr:MAG: DUF4865 domain-containing protein [Pseudonocardiales bacterium]
MTTTTDRIPTSQLVLQYPITLPTDYDMQIIRDRVRTRGSTLDNRAGLLCKAYCIREAGVAGSPVNQYAPFYLWADAGAAADFLWHGTGFDGIVRDFGRPEVRTWVPETRVLGSTPAASVTRAVLRVAPVPIDVDLVDAVGQLATRVKQRASDDGVHLALGGVDPSRWETVEFVTLAELDALDALNALDAEGTVFTVLHVSQPTAWA